MNAGSIVPTINFQMLMKPHQNYSPPVSHVSATAKPHGKYMLEAQD